ncbi:MAG: GNAT family N-acetyltransferase [Gemmatimonadaceae bacterium]|nr:GNAT family N-acetyltransferase [Gemmatimonadaceae bacterium]
MSEDLLRASGGASLSAVNRVDVQPAEDAETLDAVRMLVRSHLLAHSETHDPATTEAIAAALPAPYDAPRGGIWVARAGTDVVGCVALQPLDDDIAELKRLYVRPAWRGRGVARQLAGRAVAEARGRGYRHLRLGTLDSMIPAQKLYESLGFRRIAPYRPVELGDTLFYELTLDDELTRATR